MTGDGVNQRYNEIALICGDCYIRQLCSGGILDESRQNIGNYCLFSQP